MRLTARCALLSSALALWGTAGTGAGSAGAAGPARAARPALHALLINGGDSPSSNYLSHLHHLQDMVDALGKRGVTAERIHIFSSDGESPEPDLAAREATDPLFWLIADTPTGKALRRIDQRNTTWPQVRLNPATTVELACWFGHTGRALAAGDTLFLFVTDHGKKDPDDADNGFIMLWKERLSLNRFRELLAELDAGVQVVMVMSQCYSGAFGPATVPLGDTLPRGNVCGFFSTTADRKALGCYPEGRGDDRTGHAFRFIDALGNHATPDAAHLEVSVSDSTPDVPIRSSDLFLRRQLVAEAGRRALRLEELGDELLASAWSQATRSRPEMELLERLAMVYYDRIPQKLADLDADLEELKAMAAELDLYSDRWKLSLDALRADNVQHFLTEKPGWRDRLERAAIEALAPDQRQRLLEQLLPEIDRFSRKRADVWVRLTRLDELRAEAESARFRADTRVAAIERMRNVLLRVAGTLWLESQGGLDRLAAFRGLVACEMAPLGDTPGAAERTAETPALPALSSERAALARVLPSWLGIEFGALDDAERRALGVLAGAAQIRRVLPDSAAECAGLRQGDIVLGPPGEPFRIPGEVREWSMASPRDIPLALEVLRDGQPIEVTVTLGPYRRRG